MTYCPGACAQRNPADGATLTPADYALHGARPNPAAEATTLRYDLPEAARVTLAVYDALGREVARLVDGEIPAGAHTATFEAGALPAGVYLVRMQADGASGPFTTSGRLTLVW